MINDSRRNLRTVVIAPAFHVASFESQDQSRFPDELSARFKGLHGFIHEVSTPDFHLPGIDESSSAS